MPSLDTRTAPGDVFFLTPEDVLVYGHSGLEFRLNQRNLRTLRSIMGTDQTVKDSDSKFRRYEVSWDAMEQEFVFLPPKGDPIRSPHWLFFGMEKLAA